MPYLRSHLGWKMSLCQHLMYLLIDEDRGEPMLGERKPPWGAPDAATYVQRIERNLSAFEKIDDLKLNYQVAGVDMESIARGFPHIAEKMKLWYERGRLDFVDGSFSQGHLHTVGSESNWRQFEYGLNVFRKLFAKEITLYARQETSLHQQLPQILSQFGYRMIVMPHFPHSFEVFEGSFQMMSSVVGTGYMSGDEFLDATALDGTSIPVYLTPRASSHFEKDDAHDFDIPAEHAHNPDNVKWAISRDNFGQPPVWPWFPDMMEMQRERFEAISKFCDVQFLDEALTQRIKEAPPRAKARLMSHWSYIEGVWAEELLRANKAAEETALLAEALIAMAPRSSAAHAEQLHAIWHTILKYQHHDVWWIEITDLRRKAIGYLADAVEECKRLMGEVAEAVVRPSDNHVAFFNALPARRTALVDSSHASFPTGDPSRAYVPGLQEFGDRQIGFLDLPAGGYASYALQNTASSVSAETPLPDSIKTKSYDVEFSDTGLINQITADGNQLLAPGDYLGGEIRALISDAWYDNRNGECRFFEGNSCYILERSARIDTIPLTERYFFFRDVRAIKVELEFAFTGNDVGVFWFDETKLNVYYPCSSREIHHDIPFGYVEAREQRPLFATNWLACGGLVYVNRGTVKHWVKNGVLANVLAWGNNVFGNRLHFDFWASKREYDLRIHQTQNLEYFIVPFGAFDGPQIVRRVTDLTWPVFAAAGAGKHSAYKLKDKRFAVTSILRQEDGVYARGYKLPKSQPKPGDFHIETKRIGSTTG